jgi:RHS repeat-associated protein
VRALRQTGNNGWVDYVRWSGSVPDPNGWQTLTYTYDPAGRRIAKAVDGTTTVKYLYDGDHCIAEYDGAGSLLRKYIFGPCVDEPISMIDVEHSSATYYYHFDALGSVIALTNSSGSTVELYEYSVYGQVAASDANIPNRFMFTGREFDADTGLYYYRARYYHPEIGRFLQTDPIGYEDGMNWYQYCKNTPLSVADPLGLGNVFKPELWPTDTYNGDSYVYAGPQEIDIAFFDGSDGGSGMYDKDGKLVVSARNNETYASAVRIGVHEKSSGHPVE